MIKLYISNGHSRSLSEILVLGKIFLHVVFNFGSFAMHNTVEFQIGISTNLGIILKISGFLMICYKGSTVTYNF